MVTETQFLPLSLNFSVAVVERLEGFFLSSALPVAVIWIVTWIVAGPLAFAVPVARVTVLCLLCLPVPVVIVVVHEKLSDPAPGALNPVLNDPPLSRAVIAFLPEGCPRPLRADLI